MELREEDIIRYIEPVFRFCARRLGSRHDAEDLASEIMVHILDGARKYHIESLDGWVWRIARNRYARFIDMKNRRPETLPDGEFSEVPDDYDFVEDLIVVEEHRQMFKYLHTLSSEYRDILVDYYIGDMSVKQIAERYSLTETTVKWRLNVSREKIKTRIGENKMDKVYKRVNWNTTTCNGSFDPNKYLFSQTARAICEAAYEKPLTTEEISLKTGLPTMYIEDELPRLISGDAIVRDGVKYATNFIVLRLCDKKVLETKFAPLVEALADYFAELFGSRGRAIAEMDFYGSAFGMKKLGYIALPAVLRGKIRDVKDGLDLKNGPFPPRFDGGYGWFIVDEKDTADESLGATESGCNITDGERDFIYYFWLGKYFQNDVYHNGGTRWLHANGAVAKSKNGAIPDDALTDDDRVRLLRRNLITKDGAEFRLSFPVFDGRQYEAFTENFKMDDARLVGLISELISDIHKSFQAFVPKRLGGQINQWVSCYSHNIIGFVAEALINRGVLEKPDEDKPLTNGVFCVLGDYVKV
jgi:RNA polymerase sigma factor (sigma-70 family)